MVKHGFSREVIQDNTRTLIAAGRPPAVARRVALALADQARRQKRRREERKRATQDA
jgi:hypothetical protein